MPYKDPVVREQFMKNYYKNNAGNWQRVDWRLAKYGVSKDQYEQMLVDQDFKCRICGLHQAEQKRSLSIDHDHKTGKVRALLCHKCNTGLGRFNDSSELVAKAADYLKEFEIAV